MANKNTSSQTKGDKLVSLRGRKTTTVKAAQKQRKQGVGVWSVGCGGKPAGGGMLRWRFLKR